MTSSRRNKARGSNAERQLQHMFWNAGYAVIRAAGSGSIPIPCPDLFVMKGDKHFTIEVKFWKAKNLALSKHQFDELIEFAARAYSPVVVAWKIPNKGWHFLRPNDLHKTEKFYTISQKDAMEKGLSFDQLTGNV